MINNKDKLDGYFRDGLEDYKVSPSEKVWNNIASLFFSGSYLRPAMIRGIIVGALIVATTTVTLLVLRQDRAVEEPVQGPEYLASVPTGPAMPGTIETNPVVSEDPYVSNELTDKPSESVETTGALSEGDPGIKESPYMPKNDQTTAMEPPNENVLPGPVPENFPEPLFSDKNYHIDAYHATLLSSDQDRLFTEPSNSSHLSYRDDIKISYPNVSLKDDYAKRADIGFGVHFSPGVIYYSPNPNKNSYTLDITTNYKNSNFLAEAGIGFNRTLDIGSYRVDYQQYDSIGYYNDVTSFGFAEGNPDSIIFNYTKTTVFDSVPHYTITQRNNSYSYLTIPVSFGYRIINKGRFLSYIKAGVIYSLLIDKNEPTVDFTASDAGNVSIERQVPARVNSNWMLTTGISFGYRLSDKVVLSLEPYYWQYLNSVYSQKEGYSPNKPYVIGIRAGIDFNF